MSASVRAVLDAAYDPALVEQLCETYEEAKRNYHLGGHRLSEVEGGRFCEAAFRMLQQRTTGRFTPIGGILNTEEVIGSLAKIPAAAHPKSVRIYLPRALRVIYDIRNSRDVAHLGDGIDPSLQDSTLVVAVLDWTLAEFVRLSAEVSADVAQRMVDALVTRELPVVQVFDGQPKVLRPDLRAGDHLLVLLYHAGTEGVRFAELQQWVPEAMRTNLRRTVKSLESKALAHCAGDTVLITFAGQKRVEADRLMEPAL
ncbi:hypothetical protein [Actinosynnema mirum]|uniref:Uncharacterized protein n=1 Tax=Actinosynnema mirum (strain ATCC 29888 / DSM 43827 / JCM 3225 / NBRC 14064 / NCIMB 13271 / NRRL B-12336 / IMRU 3971 / 101) TaxID=446462 RepID=C6WP63_ACTMD|nr:hypothetical protein [Actinosynnema mirum]ACU38565.1 conserved hypothetical protein [Actinosynnema mirum DSM 43827]